jgi:hypothetical protein
MAAFGASRPLPSVPTKVRLLNRLPTLDLGGGDYSCCPLPIGNRIGLFNPQTGIASFPSSFTYWTDVLADGTSEMLAPNGKNAPAPWVPFTRAGCEVGAFSIANIEFENVTSDINTGFGPNSTEAMEAASNPTKAIADFEGIIIHCEQGSKLWSKNSAPKPAERRTRRLQRIHRAVRQCERFVVVCTPRPGKLPDGELDGGG